jgi:hypothetical protein
LFLLFSFLATAHLLVKFAPIVLLEEIDVSPALKSLLKKAVRILQQQVLSYLINLLLFSKMNDTQFAKAQKRSFREYFFPFKSALSPSQRYARERKKSVFTRNKSRVWIRLKKILLLFYEAFGRGGEEVKFFLGRDEKSSKSDEKRQNQRLPWRHHHHHRPEGPLCCVLLIKKKKPNLETRGENHPKAFIIPEGEGV